MDKLQTARLKSQAEAALREAGFSARAATAAVSIAARTLLGPTVVWATATGDPRDVLADTFTRLDPEHREGAQWFLHASTAAYLSSLGLIRAGRLLGQEVVECEDWPTTRPVMFANLSRRKIVITESLPS